MKKKQSVPKKAAPKKATPKAPGFLPGRDYVILPDLTIGLLPAAGKEKNIPPADAIGGFHTLCADVGEIPRHPLSGFKAGDILPQSLWNAHHRPACEDPRGMVYNPVSDLWVAIYLAHDDSDLLNLNYDDFVAYGADRGLRLLTHDEFSAAAEGSNEMTNISGSSRPRQSGGHVDQVGRRMVSNIGCEDCCGVLWQYLSTPHPVNSEWALLAGGYWYHGALCGSRSRNTYCYRRDSSSAVGARFASEPLHKRVARER